MIYKNENQREAAEEIETQIARRGRHSRTQRNAISSRRNA
jgi:hypothetical protein